MATNPNQKGDLFQTPNPTELKQAAKTDPIHDREDSHESDVIESATNPDRDADQDAFNLDEDAAIDSPIVKANLSGH